MVLKFILIGGVLPGFIATLALLAGWFRTRRNPAREGPYWLLPLLVVLSIIPAELLANGGRTQLWPRAVADRLPHIVLISAIAGFITALGWKLRAVRWGVPLIAFGVCRWVYLGYRYPSFWNLWETILWMAVFVLATLAAYAIIELAAQRHRLIQTVTERSPDPALIAAIFVAANALPIVLLKLHIAYLSQLCGGVVACLGAALVTSILVPKFTLSRGGVCTIVCVLSAFMIAGYYVADKDDKGAARIMMLIASVGFVLPAILLALMLRGAGVWKRLIVAVIAAGVPAGAALAIAHLPPKEPQESGSDAALEEYWKSQ